MEIAKLRPEEIEKKSFEIIEEELRMRGKSLPQEHAALIKRCIHTTADFDYADSLCFSEGALPLFKQLIRNGADIVTDTNMALAGINKKEFAKYGGSISCHMADADVAEEAKKLGITRATAAMKKAMQSGRDTIFVIGNAPTALITLYEAFTQGRYRPVFVVGVPVGFVNVEAAKELILSSGIPHIVNAGRKGGSNVAAAICNAVLYEMREEG